MNRYSRRKAFTLIEVLIALSIVVLVASFGIGKYATVQEESRIKIDIAAARQVGDAAELALLNNPDLTDGTIYEAVSKRIKMPTPVSRKYRKKGEPFKITIDKDGVPKVSSNGLEIYPDVE